MIDTDDRNVVVGSKLTRFLKFVLPQLIIACIILVVALGLRNFWHRFDSYSNSLFFLAQDRFSYLTQCYYGLEHTGQPLLREVDYTDSLGIKTTGYYQIEAIDGDYGMYYFIPLLTKLLNVKLAYVFDIFYLGIVILGFLLGVSGIKLLYESQSTRIISYTYIALLTFFCLYIFGVHVLIFFLISLIPLVLWFIKKSIRSAKIKNLYYFLIVTGLIIGIVDQFRSHTGTGLILFIAFYLIFINRGYIKTKHKAGLIIIMFISTLLCGLYFNYVVHKRDNWLHENHQGISSSVEFKYPYWHIIFLGLSYQKDNKYGIVCDDWYAFRKAYSIDPSLDFKFNYWAVITSRYEEIIRGLYLDILKKDPVFVIQTYLYKSIHILVYVLVFFNVGSILIFKVKPSYKIIIPFLIGITYYAIPGVLFIPFPRYILGVISLSAYGMLLLAGEYWKENGKRGNITEGTATLYSSHS